MIAGGQSEEYLEILCNLGLDINNQDQDGWTALHMACNGAQSYIPILLNYGADTKLRILNDSRLDEYDESVGKNLTALEIYEKYAPIGAAWRDQKIISSLS